MVLQATLIFAAAALWPAPPPVLLGPAWLAAIERRAEETAAGRDFTVTKEDLRTIKRKLDFDEATPSLSLSHLERFIGVSIARKAAESHRAAVSGCLEEMFLSEPKTSLATLARMLAAEPSRTERRRILEASAGPLWEVLPPAQYDYLTLSRQLGRFDKTVPPGFRSRHEAILPDMLNGALLILNETEPAYRSLREQLFPEGLDPADLPRVIYASLESSIPLGTRQAILERTLTTLKLDDLASSIEQTEAQPFASGVIPTDPPGRILVAVPSSPGLGGLRNLFRETGQALAFAAVPKKASFEARFLSDPSVREAYGSFFERLLSNDSFIKDVVRLPPEAEADYRQYLAFVDLTEARHLAASVLFEAALEKPGTDALFAYASLMSRAVLAPITRHQAAFYIFELERQNPIRFDALILGSRILKALRMAYGETFYRDPRALRRIRDGLRRSGFDTGERLRDRFRARREDARTLLDALLEEAAASGRPPATPMPKIPIRPSHARP